MLTDLSNTATIAEISDGGSTNAFDYAINLFLSIHLESDMKYVGIRFCSRFKAGLNAIKVANINIKFIFSDQGKLISKFIDYDIDRSHITGIDLKMLLYKNKCFDIGPRFYLFKELSDNSVDLSWTDGGYVRFIRATSFTKTTVTCGIFDEQQFINRKLYSASPDGSRF